jgi:hypothetical protein
VIDVVRIPPAPVDPDAFVALVTSSENRGHAIQFGLIMVGLLWWSIAARVRKANRRARQDAH